MSTIMTSCAVFLSAAYHPSASQPGESLRKVALIAQLVFGAITVAAFTITSLTFAVASQKQEYETINRAVQRIYDMTGEITPTHRPREKISIVQRIATVINTGHGEHTHCSPSKKKTGGPTPCR
jgi:hypothetical protein